MLIVQARQIRLFIIDPQPLIYTALSHMFDAHDSFHVVGAAQFARPLALRTVRPDVVLLGHEHGSTDVCETIGVCREGAPAAKICVISCHAHPEMLQRTIDAGAEGYTLKDASPNELMDAIRSIADGKTYVDPRVAGFLIKTRGRSLRGGNTSRLSVRETEILRLIAGGFSNKEISSTLALSEKTIKNHISHIFSKLNITARTQAVMHAIKTGLA